MKIFFLIKVLRVKSSRPPFHYNFLYFVFNILFNITVTILELFVPLSPGIHEIIITTCSSDNKIKLFRLCSGRSDLSKVKEFPNKFE